MQDATTKEAFGVATEAGTVRIERVLPGPAERVWAWLTESDKRARWLAAGETELQVGGRVELVFRHSELSREASPERYRKYEGHVSHGRVTRCEPPRILSYTWPEKNDQDSEVTFELTPRDDSVLLVVTHRRLADAAAMVNVASGWHAHLGILIDRLTEHEPRGFWSAHADAEREYKARFADESGGD